MKSIRSMSICIYEYVVQRLTHCMYAQLVLRSSRTVLLVYTREGISSRFTHAY